MESARKQGCILDYEFYFSKFKLNFFACRGRIFVWICRVIFGKSLAGYGFTFAAADDELVKLRFVQKRPDIAIVYCGTVLSTVVGARLMYYL